MWARFFSLPFFERGFRPFFLMGAFYAVMAAGVWILQLRGMAPPAPPFGDPVLWHAHEMLFGFTVAIIAGFLLTAVANWTGGETARGAHLAALCLLWTAGRAAMVADIPYVAAAVIDLAFIPALAAGLAVPLFRGRNRRNYVFLLMIGALFLSNLMFWIYQDRTVLYSGIIVVMAIISAVGGRIIPSFTVAGLRREGMDVRQTDQYRTDMAALASLFLLFAAIAFTGMDSAIAGVLAFSAAALHGLQHLHYHPLKVWRYPLLWSLHAGHLWLIAGLAMLGAAAFGLAPVSPGIHALTAGAIGSLTLSMMCRVALGHTGRIMQAGTGTKLSFLLMQGAVFIRVAGPLFAPSHYMIWIEGSALLWILAFTVYLTGYAPVLLRRAVAGA